jgi:hypothetical protein
MTTRAWLRRSEDVANQDGFYVKMSTDDEREVVLQVLKPSIDIERQGNEGYDIRGHSSTFQKRRLLSACSPPPRYLNSG